MENLQNTQFDFSHILRKDQIIQNPEEMKKYASDMTEDFVFMPTIVLLPETTEEVSSIMKHCNSYQLPVTPRAAGTGLSGGALPVNKGVVLSIERMNSILEVDNNNFQVHTQPGVICQVLQETVEEHGLYYPPDPASKGSSFIGGNVAENSGGPKALKYGVVKDYVLNLEVVLPSGEIIETGANTLKNSTGFNLTQLMVGSEGLLGIITRITLRLIPKPTHTISAWIPFESAQQACESVNAIFLAGLSPSACEFMEKSAILYTLKQANIEFTIPIEESTQAVLLVEFDGFSYDKCWEQLEQLYPVVELATPFEMLVADDEAKKDMMWAMRRKIGEAVKAHSIYKEEDAVVPRAYLPDLLDFTKKLGIEEGFESVCYGHAGDGNLHINILKGELSDQYWNTELTNAISRLFSFIKSKGGTISGEHGIGYVQKEYMSIAFQAPAIEIMKGIKQVFDPNWILNPGKMFPKNN